MQKLIAIDTRGMSREEWLAARETTIGGSDAPAIVGLDEYKTPYSLWAEKTGRVIPEDISMKEPVRLGNDLEDYVARRFMEETGKKVMRKNAILKNPEYPFAHANVDRLIVGEDAGLECKTTNSMNIKKYKGGEYPAKFYVQCMWYLAVTGRQRWYLAVLILGVEFKVFTIERDEDEINALMGAGRDFWHYVETDAEPPMTGGSADTETIAALYPQDNGESIPLFGRDAMLAEYLALGARVKELESQQERIKAEIQRDMGAAQKAVADGFKVSWRTSTRTTYDTKRFCADHPGALSAYAKETTYRAFKIEEVKNNG